MNELKIQKVTKKYRDFTALDQINLTVQPGIFGLLGPNGAGKSTLMRILTTLIPADSGTIQLGEVGWDRPHTVRGLIGYLPQKFSLYKHVKVREALKHLAKLKGMTGKIESEIENVLQLVNLLEFKEQKIGHLSGGMVRRVGIAQALLGNPKIIIVDEPTSGLDPEERIRFRNILQSIGSDAIVIISSHIVEDIETVCERAAILYQGRIMTEGSIEEIRQIARGKIWTITFEKDQFLNAKQDLKIISQNSLDGRIITRVLSETKIVENARMEEPTLEDAYFYYMQKREHTHV